MTRQSEHAMKIITVLGARPQFIKAAAVSAAIARHNAAAGRRSISEIIVHTGQHYDYGMSGVFFDELGIPEPQINLGIGNCSHGAMTGRMLEKLEAVLQSERPDWLLVYGDTNSTLAGALAAVKLHIPVAHVEAGLRSRNMAMPEEINRILTDRVSSALFCPTDAAVENLRQEGVYQHVYQVGDVMYDVALHFSERARQRFILSDWGLTEKGYVLCTVHRAENTDDLARLQQIATALTRIADELPVIFPVHPRTARVLRPLLDEANHPGIRMMEPLSFLEMMRLLMSAEAALTDSGGVQKEAFFHRIPCITLRDETEWVETVACGANRLAGARVTEIMSAWRGRGSVPDDIFPYGDGHAAEKIVHALL
jgi:UDP-GlcNAc3NAcA epimerase